MKTVKLAGAVAVSICAVVACTKALTSPTASTITLSLGGASLQVGQARNAVATVYDVNGAVTNGHVISWSSSHSGVASVSTDGLVSGLSAGSTDITASTEGVTATAPLTVVAAPVATVSVALASSNVAVGASTQASANLRDASNNVLSGRAVTWSSSATNVATVSSSGLVAAVGAGSANISATSEGVTGSATVTVSSVTVPVASVSVALGTSTLAPGATTQAIATLRDASNNQLAGRSVTWSSSNANAATVNASGLVTAINAGAATITATSEGQAGSAALTVTVAPVAAVSVTIDAGSIAVGGTAHVTATMRDARNNVLSGRAVSWASANTGIATVNSAGLVTGVSAGATTIVGTSEGVTGSAGVTVTASAPTPVATVSVSLTTSTLAPGGSATASALLRDANNNVLSGRTVTWSSSQSGVATVSAFGQVNAVASGNTNIVATSEGKSGSAPLAVASVQSGSNEPAGAVAITERAFDNTIEDGWTLPSFAVPYLTITQDGTAPKSPSNVAQIRYPAGFGGGDSPALAERDLTSGSAATLYVSMWIKLSSNWVGHPTGTNKVMHFWINGANRVFAFADGSGSNTLTPRIGLQAINGAYSDGNGNTSTTVELRPNVSGQTGAQIIRGQWQRWEIAMTSNTNGASNGTLDWWINGTLVGHYTGINYVPAGAGRTWDIVKWDPTWGGLGGTIPVDQFMYLDHLYISGKP